MNTCEHIQEILLDGDWTESSLAEALDALEHLRTCPQCTAVVRGFASLRGGLQVDMPGVPAGGWDAMEQRLLRNVTRRRRPDPRLWMALAASLLIALIGYGIGRWSGPKSAIVPVAVQPSNPVAAPRVAMLSQADIDRQVKAFDEVSGVFDRHATWLLVGDNTSDMGVSNSDIGPQRQILLLRLTMVRSGAIISNADLAILPGQQANLTVPVNSETSLRYHIEASQQEPTRLTLSTQLTTPHHSQVLAALETTLNVEPGQRLSAGNMVTSNGEFNLEIAFGRANLDPGR
jgi:anti-sigma factor RsiW